jgi:hypothetical protein
MVQTQVEAIHQRNMTDEEKADLQKKKYVEVG